jgi:hypothetical protein
MNKKIVAMGLAAIGIIFFLAGTFQILAENVSTFGGVVFIMLSGLTWAFWPKN